MPKHKNLELNLLCTGGDSYFPCSKNVPKHGSKLVRSAEILTAKNMGIEEYFLKFSAL